MNTNTKPIKGRLISVMRMLVRAPNPTVDDLKSYFTAEEWATALRDITCSRRHGAYFADAHFSYREPARAWFISFYRDELGLLPPLTVSSI